jgi:hypothetical protein
LCISDHVSLPELLPSTKLSYIKGQRIVFQGRVRLLHGISMLDRGHFFYQPSLDVLRPSEDRFHRCLDLFIGQRSSRVSLVKMLSVTPDFWTGDHD